MLVDIDLDVGTATSTTAYTVAQQVPGSDRPFELLVAGRYEDRWGIVDGEWHWTDRYIVVQFKNDLNAHMHTRHPALQLRPWATQLHLARLERVAGLAARGGEASRGSWSPLR